MLKARTALEIVAVILVSAYLLNDKQKLTVAFTIIHSFDVPDKLIVLLIKKWQLLY